MAKNNILMVSDKPVGTMAEAQASGGDLRNVASCSRQSGDNKGCAWHAVCRFREYRDKGIGPENVGCDIITAEGAAGVWIGPCYDFYYSGLNDRHQNMAESHEVINPAYRVGDKVTQLSSVALHPTPEPATCIACKQGNCNKRKMEEREIEIPPFDRPGQVYKQSGYAERIKAKALESMERETIRGNLGQPAQAPRAKDKGGDRS